MNNIANNIRLIKTIQRIKKIISESNTVSLLQVEPFVEDLNTYSKEYEIGNFYFHSPNHLKNSGVDLNGKGIEALRDHMEIIEVLIDKSESTTDKETSSNIEVKQKIFIVHGRDEYTRNEAELLLHRIGIEPVILSFQANQGATLIDKFEKYADVLYAIVLLTPDDFGGLEGTSISNLRARQNVIFELGYFYGKLGRSNVCIVMKSDVEIPSDIQGVVYTRFENKLDEVKSEIYREMSAAGIKFKEKY